MTLADASVEIVAETGSFPQELTRSVEQAARKAGKAFDDTWAAQMRTAGGDAADVLGDTMGRKLSQTGRRAAKTTSGTFSLQLNKGMSEASNEAAAVVGSVLSRHGAVAGAAAGAATAQGFNTGLEAGVRSAGPIRDSRGRFVRAGQGLGRGLGEGIGEGLDDSAPLLRQGLIRAADSAAGGFRRRFGTAMGAAVRTGVLATVAGLGLVGGIGLKAAGDLEQTRISFDSLTGSAKAGGKMLADLQQFAAKTPFEFPEVAGAAKRVLAFGDAVGITQDELIPLLTTIGNVASVTGGGAQGMDRVTLALGQIASKGKVSLEELNQISESMPGFSALQAIAAARGMTTAEAMDSIEEGGINAEDGINAVIRGMKKFKGATGAMEKQSETLLGMLSTFKDTARLALIGGFLPVIPEIKDSLGLLTPIVEDAAKEIAPALGGLFADAMPLLGGALKGLSKVLTPALEAISTAISLIDPSIMVDLGTALGGLVTALAPVLPALVDALIPALIAMTDVLVALTPLMVTFGQDASRAIGWFMDHSDVLVPIIAGLWGMWKILGIINAARAFYILAKDVGFLAAMTERGGRAAKIAAVGYRLQAAGQLLAAAAAGIATAAQWAWNAATYAFPGTWIVVAILAVIAAIVLLIVYWDEVVAWSKKAWGAIVEGAKAAWEWLKKAGKAIGKFFADLPGKIAEAWDSMVEFFSELPGKIGDFLSKVPGIIGNALAAAATAVLEGIGMLIAIAVFTVTKLPGKIIGAIAGLVTMLWSFFTRLFVTVSSAIGRGITAVVDFFKNLPGRILAAIISLGTTISAWWTSTWEGVKTLVRTGINNVVDFFRRLPGRVMGFLAALPGRVRTLFRTVMSEGRRMVSEGIGKILGFFQSLPGKISGLLSGIGTSIWDALKGSLSWGINNILNPLISGYNKLAPKLGLDKLDPIVLAEGAVIDEPTIALMGEGHRREVVIPLTKPRRAAQLAEESGLIGMLERMGSLRGKQVTINAPIYLTTAASDPDLVARRTVRRLTALAGV